MKRLMLGSAKIILVALLLVSCAAPVEQTKSPETDASVSTEMSTMETAMSTETMAATLESTATQEATASSTVTLEATMDSSSVSEGVEVEIEDFAYVSATVTIKAGTTVTWENKDKVQHTVTSDSGLFDSGLLAKGVAFSYTFTEPGTYTYHCAPHPNMKGTIIVE